MIVKEINYIKTSNKTEELEDIHAVTMTKQHRKSLVLYTNRVYLICFGKPFVVKKNYKVL